jgi:DNA replication and repair protein RecF
LTQLPVFSFTAPDLEIVRGGPEARRRFLDRGVSSIKPAYLQTITDYARVIKQKNRLLQGANEENSPLNRVEQLIRPWNDQLIKLAGIIHRERSDYVMSLSLALERGKGDLTAYEDLLDTRLRLRLQAEIASGHALIGPHRDDLEVLLEGREIRAFGSSGQQRSALLLLDLAAISLYNLAAREAPIFIIDDVDAELDENRIRHLLEYLEDRTQTFITTSKRSHVEGFLSRASVYEIEDGAVRDRGTRAEVA